MDQQALQGLVQHGYKLTPATLAVTLTQNDNSQKEWIPARHLLYLSELVSTKVAQGHGRIMVTMPPRHGKALRNGTLVHTPRGMEPIESLKVGDTVVTPSGEAKIRAVYPQGKVQLYRMVLADGATVECCADHVWYVRESTSYNTRTWKHLNVRDIMAKSMQIPHGNGTYKNRWHIPAMPIQVTRKELPIEPYTLGALIGDGSLTQHPSICCHVDDTQTLDEIRNDGYTLGKPYTGHRSNTVSHQLIDKPYWVGLLTEVGLYGHKSESKCIPAMYFGASIEQRTALLQGLMDTDGTVGSGSAIFNTSSPQLAKDVRRLVFSLGGISSISERSAPSKKGHLTAYNVNMRLPKEIKPFRLIRKLLKCNSGKLPSLRPIKSIEATGVDYATCISLDSDDGLFFCTENAIVTHNSEFLSVNTTTWFLEKYPQKYVMLLSYGAELATDFAYRVRANFLNEELGRYLSTRLNKRKLKIDRFLTTRGGGVTAAGLGGTITGRGGDLILVDDYIKNAEEAVSQTLLDKTYEWFKSTCFTRLEPEGTIVILATRWAQNDLIGRLLDDNPDMWELINLPARAEENDPLGREVGEPLWPERFDDKALQEIEDALGSFWWRAMYQQRPPASLSAQDLGDMIKTVERSDVPPESELRTCRAWDLAASEYAQADWTAGAKISFHKETGNVYIRDMRRVQKGPETVARLVETMADLDGHGCAIWMEQEPGSSGVTVIDHYKSNVLSGYSFDGERATGPVEIRATPLLAACEAGNVFMVAGDWNHAMVHEINGFPDGEHDDQVVALALAFNKVVKNRASLIWGEHQQGEIYKEYQKRVNIEQHIGVVW